MKNLGYYNGRIGLIEEMTIPMNDRACWFGDGVYDATYSRNYKIYTLYEHLDRFYRSAGLLGIVVPQKKEELAGLLCEMVKKLDTGEQLVYWQVTRGTGMRSHAAPRPATPGNLWITLRPKSVMNTYEKVRLITYPDTRFLHCNIKTLNLIPRSACPAVAAAGCYELSSKGVTGISSNIHIIKDGVFHRAGNNYILAGSPARSDKILRAAWGGVRERPLRLNR